MPKAWRVREVHHSTPQDPTALAMFCWIACRKNLAMIPSEVEQNLPILKAQAQCSTGKAFDHYYKRRQCGFQFQKKSQISVSISRLSCYLF